MNDIEQISILVGLTGLVLTGALYVAFGQITVRRLRSNPETKNSLGLTLFSGGDISNVAGLLCLPRTIARKASTRANNVAPNRLANIDLIYKNTTRYERLLGRFFVIAGMLSLVALLTASVS
jgi:hypothetical protein